MQWQGRSYLQLWRLEHRPAVSPLVPLRGLLLGSTVAGVYLLVLHLQASGPLDEILLESLVGERAHGRCGVQGWGQVFLASA